MSVAIRLSPREAKIFKKHAARSGMTLSDFAAAGEGDRVSGGRGVMDDKGCLP